jgi:hypothetical protein
LIAGCASVQGTASNVTIEELIAKAEVYRDKTVVVRGQLDNCTSLTCNLCPEDMTNGTFDRNKCLGLEFDGFGPSGSWATSRTAQAMEKAFRFATVTLSAHFDPTCLTGKDPSDPKATVVCTDRASALYDAIVQKVHSRKNGDTGIVSWYDFGVLSAPTDNDRRTMLALLNDLDPNNKRPLALFVVPHDSIPDNVEAEGMGCYCLIDSCEGKWPRKWVGGFSNYGNDFYCFEMQKKHGVWSFLPGEED